MTSKTRRKKLFNKINQKRCKSVRFDDLCTLVEAYGWVLDRVAKNNHYYYVHPDHAEAIINIAKPHQGDVKRHYCRTALRIIQEFEEDDGE